MSIYPSTPEAFERRFGHQTVLQSVGDLAFSSGSHWTVAHLEACRVLAKKDPSGLPILKDDIESASAIISVFPEFVDDLTGLSATQLERMGNWEIREKGGVFESFLVALADVTRLPKLMSVLASTSRPQRNARVVVREGFVTGQGLSSPLSAGSSGGKSSSFYSPASQISLDFEEQLDRKKHETLVADMAGQFISTVLDRLSGQSSRKQRLEFLKAPTSFHLKNANLDCTCQDDGSIVLRRFDHLQQKWVTKSLIICSLEAKALYTQVDDVSGRGKVAESVLAQQFCEMLGCVISAIGEGEHVDMQSYERCRFLISVHHTNMTFLQADFSKEYMDYIYSTEPPLTLPYLTIHQSKDYDLRISAQRKAAAQVLVALVIFSIREGFAIA